MSRSPSPNQVGSAPYAASSSLNAPALLGPAPAAFRVDTAAERVHHAVQVRADSQPVQRDVVAGIHDRYDLVGRMGGTNPPQVARAAYASGQHCDAHVSNLR